MEIGYSWYRDVHFPEDETWEEVKEWCAKYIRGSYMLTEDAIYIFVEKDVVYFKMVWG